MKTHNQIIKKLKSLKEYREQLHLSYENKEIDVKSYSDGLIYASHCINMLERIVAE